MCNNVILHKKGALGNDDTFLYTKSLIMKIHRFYLPKISYHLENSVTITDEKLVHQVCSVLRLRVGEYIDLFDGEERVERFEISRITKKDVVLIRKEVLPMLIPKYPVSVAFSLVKKDNIEWIVQKVLK